VNLPKSEGAISEKPTRRRKKKLWSETERSSKSLNGEFQENQQHGERPFGGGTSGAASNRNLAQLLIGQGSED